MESILVSIYSATNMHETKFMRLFGILIISISLNTISFNSVNAQPDMQSLYDGLNSNFKSEIQFQLAVCSDKVNQYNDLSSGLKSAPVGQSLYNDLLACDSNPEK